MNISYNWLKNYIATDLPAEKIAEILTDIGQNIGLFPFKMLRFYKQKCLP